MAGFAILVDWEQPVTAKDAAWEAFVNDVKHYKRLSDPQVLSSGEPNVLAAKFDMPSTLHRSVLREDGAWCLAAGTIIDPDNEDMRIKILDGYWTTIWRMVQMRFSD